MKQTFFIYAIIFFVFFITKIFAKDITIQTVNASKDKRSQLVTKIELIALQNSMQVIRTIKPHNSKVVIRNITVNQQYPLMLRATYQNITYNQILPPSDEKKIKITLPVYDVTSRFNLQKITVKVLYVLKYVGNKLQVLTLYNFDNTSKKTFAESNGRGIFIFLPPDIGNVQASVQIGNGKSNINWLKLKEQLIRKTDGLYVLPYPVRPGEKIYQVSYELDYSQQKIALTLQNYYTPDKPPHIVLDTADLQISLQDKPNITLEKKYDDTLGQSIIVLPRANKTIRLEIAGGSSQDEKETHSINSEKIIIRSLLTNNQKIILIAVTLLFFVLFSLAIMKSPLWLRKLLIKRKAILQFQLQFLQESTGNLQEIKVIKNKINSVNKYLNES